MCALTGGSACATNVNWGRAVPNVERVGTPEGIELIEITRGEIVHVTRETSRRVYGVVLAADGEPDNLGVSWFETSFRKDRIVNRTSLTADRPWKTADGKATTYAGANKWQIGTPQTEMAANEKSLLERYPTPALEWPEEVRSAFGLQYLRDRIAGTLLGGALGDGLARQVDGLSRKEGIASLGPSGVQGLPTEGGRSSDATALTVILANALASENGRVSPERIADGLKAWNPIGHGVGPDTENAAKLLRSGQSWVDIAKSGRGTDNGASVRSPVIGLLYTAGRNSAPLLIESVRAALVTHSAPVGVAGAVSIAAATGYLVRLAATGAELDPALCADTPTIANVNRGSYRRKSCTCAPTQRLRPYVSRPRTGASGTRRPSRLEAPAST